MNHSQTNVTKIKRGGWDVRSKTQTKIEIGKIKWKGGDGREELQMVRKRI